MLCDGLMAVTYFEKQDIEIVFHIKESWGHIDRRAEQWFGIYLVNKSAFPHEGPSWSCIRLQLRVDAEHRNACVWAWVQQARRLRTSQAAHWQFCWRAVKSNELLGKKNSFGLNVWLMHERVISIITAEWSLTKLNEAWRLSFSELQSLCIASVLH